MVPQLPGTCKEFLPFPEIFLVFLDCSCGWCHAMLEVESSPKRGNQHEHNRNTDAADASAAGLLFPADRVQSPVHRHPPLRPGRHPERHQRAVPIPAKTVRLPQTHRGRAAHPLRHHGGMGAPRCRGLGALFPPVGKGTQQPAVHCGDRRISGIKNRPSRYFGRGFESQEDTPLCSYLSSLHVIKLTN